MVCSPWADLQAPYVLLENRTTPDVTGRLFRRPVSTVICRDAGGVEKAFAALEQGLASGLHAAGLLSYELAYDLEPRLAGLMPGQRDTPLISIGLFEAPDLIDPQDLDAMFSALGPPPPITGLQRSHNRAAHVQKVQEILRLINAGDAYQINLTFPLMFQYDGDPLRLYAAMRASQPVGYGGIAAFDDETVLSVSPELSVHIAGDRATARPMKGTSARGADPEADRMASETLVADPKQRAENLMIVDLLRNDLARVSRPGSVKVPSLFTVETYPGFHALTSTVTARLQPGKRLRERVAALFPCGSVVGAPKIRAHEIIRALEPQPRGIYTGALGAIEPSGDMTFNVAIRTLVLKPNGQGRYGVGGGIVADSDPDAEYDEALLKGRVLTNLARDYHLIETFRWSYADGFVRLALHLDRLARSAHQLGFVFDEGWTKTAVNALARDWTAQSGDRRVRLALSRGGGVEASHAPWVANPQILRVGVAHHRMDPGDPFLRHKTSRRDVYDRAFADVLEMGLDEALFLNRRGEVAEASRHTVFVRLDGRLVTPPLTAGVLPGILRQVLISSGKAVEGLVMQNDLRASPSWFLGNSLNGLRKAVLVD